MAPAIEDDAAVFFDALHVRYAETMRTRSVDLLGASILHRDLPAAAFLLEHCDADVDNCNADGLTAAHHAARVGDLGCLALLCANGCDLAAPSSSGLRPARLAAQHGNAECLNWLISLPESEGGGGLREATVPDQSGWTPALAAASNGHADCLRVLRESGRCNLSSTNSKDGASPASLAAEFGHVGVLAMLRDCSAALDRRDRLAWTPVHSASDAGHVDCLVLLRDAGCDLSAAASDGSTALLLASAKGHLECVKVLLAAGADPTAYRLDPGDMMCEGGGSGGGVVNPLSEAQRNGHNECQMVLRGCTIRDKKLEESDEAVDASI